MDTRSFREELADALCRLRDAPESADGFPDLSAYIELLREYTEPHFRTSAARTGVERLVDDSPYEPDDLRLKNFRRQQAAARPGAQSDEGAGHAPHPSKLPTAWPGLMCAAMAAYYLGQLAVSTFLREVAAARIPQPVAITVGVRRSSSTIAVSRGSRASTAWWCLTSIQAPLTQSGNYRFGYLPQCCGLRRRVLGP